MIRVQVARFRDLDSGAFGHKGVARFRLGVIRSPDAYSSVYRANQIDMWITLRLFGQFRVLGLLF